MDNIDLTPLIDELAENIDSLQEVITPVFKDAITQSAGRLPLLDRAKLYVLLAYSIESIIFCSSHMYIATLLWSFLAYMKQLTLPYMEKMPKSMRYFEN
jgi:hypothetical protein